MCGRHVRADAKDDPFGGELLDAKIQHTLLHLEVGDAVAEEAAHAIVALEDDDVVAGARELLRRGEPGGAAPDDGHALARTACGGARFEAVRPARDVRDRPLDRLDRHGYAVDREHARRLARRRADAPRHLGEVVGLEEPLGRLVVSTAVDEIVPLRNQVSERTARVAKRDAAIHAARRLRADIRFARRDADLTPVADALFDRAILLFHPIDLQKAARITHRPPP